MPGSARAVVALLHAVDVDGTAATRDHVVDARRARVETVADARDGVDRDVDLAEGGTVVARTVAAPPASLEAEPGEVLHVVERLVIAPHAKGTRGEVPDASRRLHEAFEHEAFGRPDGTVGLEVAQPHVRGDEHDGVERCQLAPVRGERDVTAERVSEEHDGGILGSVPSRTRRRPGDHAGRESS